MYIIYSYDNNPQYDNIVIKNEYAYYSNPQYDIYIYIYIYYI